MINNDSVSAFFLGTTARLKSYRDFLELNAVELAPQFNSFNFIKCKENVLSDIIAFMLDPKGDHAQKETFLKLFLEELNLDNFKDLNLQMAKVEREHTTENYRRIDLLVRFETNNIKHWIGIENKPWAGDQYKQVEDYLNYIDDRIGKWGGIFKFIYIPAYEGDPEENSLPDEIKEKYKKRNQYLSISYREVKGWVRKCRLNCEAERVRSFLSDFERFIEKEFYGGTEMESEIIKKQILDSDNNYEVALLVANSMQDIKISLLAKLKKDLEEEIQKRKLELILIWKLSYNNRETYFGFYRKNWQKYLIAFQSDETRMNDFAYGIGAQEGKEKESKLNDKDAVNKIVKCFGEGDNGMLNTEAWLWGKYGEENEDYKFHRSWDNNRKPWMDIENGEMAKKIIIVTLELAEKLEKFHTDTGIEI